MKAITTNDVPRLRFSGMPRTPVITGTKMTPPPMPRRPEANPAMSPVRAMARPDGWTGRPAVSGRLFPVPRRYACQPISRAVARSRPLGSTNLVR